MNQSAANLPAAPQCAPSREIDELPLPYVEIDAHGLITRANRATLALHHPEQGDLIGKSGWDLMAVDEKDRSSAAFLSLMESGEDPPVITRSIFDRSGSFRTYEFHRSLVRDAMGKPAGMRMVCVDVTERARALEEARRAQQWLESAMASLVDAFILTDTLGVVRWVNPATEGLSGSTAQELKGKMIDEVMPIRNYQSVNGPPLNRRAAIAGACRGIAGVLTRDRKEVRVEISTSPIVDKESGSISGVAALLRKI
jgi:PAS domain S-box-containing protein